MKFFEKYNTIADPLKPNNKIFIGAFNNFDEVIGKFVLQREIYKYSHDDIFNLQLVKYPFRYLEKDHIVYWWNYNDITDIQKSLAEDYLEKRGYKVYEHSYLIENSEE